MNGYQIAFTAMIGSMGFWFGMALMAMVMLGLNLTTFRFQPVSRPGRWHYQRISGIEMGRVWRTLEPWTRAGWDIVIIEDQRGVGIKSATLRKFE